MAIRSIYEDMENMSVVAQKADLIDEFFLPAAKLSADGLSLHLTGRGFQHTKRFAELVLADLFARLLGRKTNALPFLIGACGAGAGKSPGHERECENFHQPKLSLEQ